MWATSYQIRQGANHQQTSREISCTLDQGHTDGTGDGVELECINVASTVGAAALIVFMDQTEIGSRKRRNKKGIAQSRASNAAMLSLFQYHIYIIAKSKDGGKLSWVSFFFIIQKLVPCFYEHNHAIYIITIKLKLIIITYNRAISKTGRAAWTLNFRNAVFFAIF
jgi:hypothetical protein